jgi:hypothetical protein
MAITSVTVILVKRIALTSNSCQNYATRLDIAALGGGLIQCGKSLQQHYVYVLFQTDVMKARISHEAMSLASLLSA